MVLYVENDVMVQFVVAMPTMIRKSGAIIAGARLSLSRVSAQHLGPAAWPNLPPRIANIGRRSARRSPQCRLLAPHFGFDPALRKIAMQNLMRSWTSCSQSSPSQAFLPLTQKCKLAHKLSFTLQTLPLQLHSPHGVLYSNRVSLAYG